MTASFRPVSYSEDFESGTLTKLAWVTGGSAPWTVQNSTASHSTYAAQAGAIGNSQTSSLSLAAFSGGGVGSFDLKVSSELDWDYLEFYLNGLRLQRWSGEVAWTTFQFPIPAGNNTYEWRYVKDADHSAGQDTAWIDNVQLRFRPAIDGTSAATIKFVGFQDGKGQLSVTGQLGQTYNIQVSSDLGTWSTIATKVNIGGTFVISDTEATKAVRFYRAIVAP